VGVLPGELHIKDYAIMEQSIRNATYPQTRPRKEQPAPTLTLYQLYLRVIALLVASFALISLGAVTMSKYIPPPPNPFVAYLDIFPGQPMSAVVQRGFSCQSIENYYTNPPESRCILTLTNRIFSTIQVAGSNQRVREIKFTLSENRLRLGDLLVMFGLPRFRSYPQITFAFWRDYFVSAPTSGRAMVNPVSQPVWSVAFTWAQKT
jgi:hypothetical protein